MATSIGTTQIPATNTVAKKESKQALVAVLGMSDTARTSRIDASHDDDGGTSSSSCPPKQQEQRSILLLRRLLGPQEPNAIDNVSMMRIRQSLQNA